MNELIQDRTIVCARDTSGLNVGQGIYSKRNPEKIGFVEQYF
jgi:hypothetical protein